MPLHLRRALRPLSSAASAIRRLPPPPSPCALTPSKFDLSSRTILYPISRSHRMMGFAPFRSSAALRDRRSDPGEGKIDPNEILFEGCDYNHWLITMDFPKDQNLTPEEKVETYVQTLAKVVGSREEAMKRMYACSTTTYTGFQAVMTEEMSEKFRGLPGVVFILPDSYIDPVNKEYGGDKYEMGKITPRPPPVQYGRQGRYGDRNRNYDRPRYDRPRVSGPDQGSQSYNYRQGPIQGDGRNYSPQQNYNPMGQPSDQQNYNPMGQPSGVPYGRPGPMLADGRSLGPQQNYSPIGQQNGMQYDRPGPPQGDGGNYIPNQNYNPMARQGGVPYEQQSYNQGTMSNYAQQNPYPGGQQGGIPYAQQNTVPGHGSNYPPQQRYNHREQPGSPPYGQEGPMNGEAKYHTQTSYSSSPGTGTEANPSVERRDYSQYTGGSRENFDSPYLRNNQGQQ